MTEADAANDIAGLNRLLVLALLALARSGIGASSPLMKGSPPAPRSSWSTITTRSRSIISSTPSITAPSLGATWSKGRRSGVWKSAARRPNVSRRRRAREAMAGRADLNGEGCHARPANAR